jgi:hypothetical protein
VESRAGRHGGHLFLGHQPKKHHLGRLFAHGQVQAGRTAAHQNERPYMEATMQRLILVTLVMQICGMIFLAHADVKEYDGPYGMKALVIERNGEKLLAWKIPSADAKLLFLGSVYDGNENLSWTYSRKLLGVERLETEAVGVVTHGHKGGKKLYIFFDPACDTCRILYEKFKTEPPGCPLVWVPISIIDDSSADQLGTQWLITAMPEAADRFNLFDSRKFKEIKKGNYQLVKWLRAADEPLSVPTFAWVDENDQVQLWAGDEMTAEKLEKVINYLKGEGK